MLLTPWSTTQNVRNNLEHHVKRSKKLEHRKKRPSIGTSVLRANRYLDRGERYEMRARSLTFYTSRYELRMPDDTFAVIPVPALAAHLPAHLYARYRVGLHIIFGCVRSTSLFCFKNLGKRENPWFYIDLIFQ